MSLTDQEQVILKAIDRVRHGDVALISDVLRAVGYPKATTKKILARLADKGIVALLHHDYPQSLTPAERKLMLRLKDSQGRWHYFSAVSVMKRNPKGKHLRGATAKQERQYEHILESAKKYHRYGKRKKEVAARTVRKRNPTIDAAERSALQKAIEANEKGKPLYVRKAGLAIYRRLEKAGLVYIMPPNFGWTDYSVRSTAAGRALMASNPTKSKGKTALKRTGRALKGFARGALSAGSEILGAGAMALNPVRRKVRNKYIDLVIKGQAKMTPKGWQVGKKHFAQGRGTVNVSSSYYLDRHTGIVYAKRERNKAKKKAGKKHASRASRQRKASSNRRHRVAGKTGRRVNASHKVSATARRKPVVKTRKAATKRVASRKNPSAESIRKKFAGRVSGERNVFVPSSAPKGKLAKLGNLVSITTEEGTIKPVHGSAVLLADTRGKLHVGSLSGAPLFDGPRRSFGEVKRIEYDDSKPHLGFPNPIIWHHRMGEETGHRPTLHADGQGGLVFRGGRYRLTRRGIEN